MMRVKVEKTGSGLHPNEVEVAIQARDGRHMLAVWDETLQENTIGVGWPVGRDGDYLLVELPRETFAGFWRVWVPADQVVPEER